MKKFAFLLSVFISVFTLKIFSQEPFSDEIRAFKIEDSLHKPPQHAILFVGSSSFSKMDRMCNLIFRVIQLLTADLAVQVCQM